VFHTFERNELKAIIEENGGVNVSAISKNTDFVLAGENMGPAKLEKAANLKIPILNEDAFKQMIGLD
jgi:DNA ligase (NAD+)